MYGTEQDQTIALLIKLGIWGNIITCPRWRVALLVGAGRGLEQNSRGLELEENSRKIPAGVAAARGEAVASRTMR